METVFDWGTMAIFAGLITLFLNRSARDNPPDTVWHYLPPMIGCAVANYVGNELNAIGAVAIIVAVLAYVWYVLKPGRAA